MAASKPADDRFDEMLGRALRRHSEPVPPDFTDKMLAQIRASDQRRILAQTIRRGRLALAASIVVAAAAIVAIVVFPARIAEVLGTTGAYLAARGQAVLDAVPDAVGAAHAQWRMYAVLALLVGFAVFSLWNLLVGERFGLG